MGWSSNSEDKAAMRRTGSKNTRPRKTERRITCTKCNGAGEVDGWGGPRDRKRCTDCNGVGQVTA